MLRGGPAPRSRLRRCDGEPDVPLRKAGVPRGGDSLGGPRVANPGGAGALVRERPRSPRAARVHASDSLVRALARARSDSQGGESGAPTRESDAGEVRL